MFLALSPVFSVPSLIDSENKSFSTFMYNLFSEHLSRSIRLFSLNQSHEMSNYGALRSCFMNAWSLGTSGSSLTAIEVIPVLPECLRSFLTKCKQVQPSRIVSVFTSRASPTNLCLHVLLLDEVTFSITQALTPVKNLLLGWYCLYMFRFVLICYQQFVHFNSGENFDLYFFTCLMI